MNVAQEIARTGPKTVEFHLGHVYGKLGVRSHSELVRRVAGLS